MKAPAFRYERPLSLPEAFALLAAHAATAIFAAKLYAQSERKLNTIQSFLDLLTTTS